MRISSKITLLVLFLLIAVAINSYIGTYQLSKVSKELEHVVNQDIALIEITTMINQQQLSKALLFERVLNAAEELAFSDNPPARRKYLFDHIDHNMNGFKEVNDRAALNIIKAKEIIENSISEKTSLKELAEFNLARQAVRKIEKEHIDYELLIADFYQRIIKGGFQLSFDDLDRVQSKERAVTGELKRLVQEIKTFSYHSIERAKEEKLIAEQLLWRSFTFGIVVSLIFALLIILNIRASLRKLQGAAHTVAGGNFDVRLNHKSKDEIGEVAQAFDVMTKKLAEYKKEIEEKNAQLKKNLELTQEQKQELEIINRELDDFVYTVSHDMGSPLRGIAWYGAKIKEKYSKDFDEDAKEAINTICEQTENINRMIEDLLSLTRITRIKNPYEEASSATMVHAVILRLEFNIKQSNVELVVPKNLPVLMCDRIKLTEVFYNLINNAIKFSSKDNKNRPRVEVGYEKVKDGHQFFVRDNGIGIDPQYHDHVFNIFKRLNKSSEYQGSGAGLSIVKRVIDDHKGKIWIESELGQGASFYFIIPEDLQNTNQISKET